MGPDKSVLCPSVVTKSWLLVAVRCGAAACRGSDVTRWDLCPACFEGASLD